MHTIDTIQEFLLSENLLEKEAIIFGDFEATSINRRNQNIQITTLNDTNFLIKQVKDLNSENAKTLKKEAQFYNYFNTTLPNLKKYLPEIKFVDIQKNILVMTFYKEAMPLWRYYNEKTIDKFPLNTVKTIGKLLGEIHITFSKNEIFQDKNLDFLNDELPFIFNLYKPHPSRLSYLGGGGYYFIEQLQQQQDIMMVFNKIPTIWKKNALIHGDIKLDNFIVLDPENKASSTIKLVDWEMLQFGDTAWDLAGVFNDFIFWWIITMPDNKSAEEMIKNARFPFHKLHPAINLFWDSYCETLTLNNQKNSELLKKVILFTGFRLLQTSFEIASKFNEMPSIAEVFLNLGKSIIRKPESSQENLFGILKKETIS